MDQIILPKPKKIKASAENDSFFLNDRSKIYFNCPECEKLARLVKTFIEDARGLKLDTVQLELGDGPDSIENIKLILISDQPNQDNLKSLEDIDDTHLDTSRDFYKLLINASGIFLVSSTIQGLYNAFWTFKQLKAKTASNHDDTKNKKTTDGKGASFPGIKVIDYPDLEFRAVQIHLKTQLHKFDYLKAHVRLLASLKINAILWEWEDKLPFREELGLRHPLAFEEDQARELVQICQDLQVEAIPLVQTYGHLEFVLKHERYKHLREKDVPSDLDKTIDICALHPETLPLLTKMVEDMVRFHPNSRYLHIGGDEVYTIGSCERCQQFIKQHGNGNVKVGISKLYVTHMNKIIKIVKSLGKTPMMWHDYLLKYPHFLDELDKDVIIVYWRYGKDLERENFTAEINFFKDKGFKVLAANSLRSTFQVGIPNYSERFRNIHDLNKALVNKNDNILGILATSWAMCMIPMETAVPALFFHAENAWNVNKNELKNENLKYNVMQALTFYFKVEPDKITTYENILVKLQDALVRIRMIKPENIPEIKNYLIQAKHEWQQLLLDAKAGHGVIENMILGFEWQILKTEIFELINNTLETLNIYGNDVGPLPKPEKMKAIIKDLNNMINDIRKLITRTKGVYSKENINEEIDQEIVHCVSKVPAFLEELIKKFKTTIYNMKNLEDACNRFKESTIMQIPPDLKNLLTRFLTNVENYLDSGTALPTLDEMEYVISMIEKHAKKSINKVPIELLAIEKAIKRFHDDLEEFLCDFFISSEKLYNRFL
ncbi:MAG: family 20 glycosylhydrolase [Promethearchaeota archaeon]